MRIFASVAPFAVLFTIGHATESMSAVTPPTIADIGTAMLADDRCFDGANRSLALYWATGVQFYTEQGRDPDPQHPSVVMAHIRAHINEEAIGFEDKAALDFRFASKEDRGAFCAAALKAAKSVPLNSVAGFASANAMPMVPHAPAH